MMLTCLAFSSFNRFLQFSSDGPRNRSIFFVLMSSVCFFAHWHHTSTVYHPCSSLCPYSPFHCLRSLRPSQPSLRQDSQPSLDRPSRTTSQHLRSWGRVSRVASLRPNVVQPCCCGLLHSLLPPEYHWVSPCHIVLFTHTPPDLAPVTDWRVSCLLQSPVHSPFVHRNNRRAQRL